MIQTTGREEVSQKVCAAICDGLGIEWDQALRLETTFLGGDLVQYPSEFLQIKMQLEREFSIKIPPHELFVQSPDPGDWMTFQVGKGMTVSDAIKYICGRLKACDE